jgi:alpha-1,2-mannosyltransferase
MSPRIKAGSRNFRAVLNRTPNLTLWLVGVGLWIALAIAAFRSWMWGIDLEVFRNASRAVLHGQNPYNLSFTFVHLPYTYPPSSFLLLLPLGFATKTVAEVLWLLSNATVTTEVIRRAMKELFDFGARKNLAMSVAAAPLLTFVLQPLRSNFGFGQINFILFLLVVISCVGEMGQWRGVLIGVAAAIKLIPLGFILFFFVQGDFRAIRRTAITFAGLVGLAWIALPRESMRYWSAIVFHPSRAGGLKSVQNQSIDGLLHRLVASGLALGLIWVGAVGVVVCLALPLARSLLVQRRRFEALAVIAIAIDLSSPISWSHHWVEVVLVPLLLVRGFRGQPAVAGASLLFLFAALFRPFHWRAHDVIAPFISFPLVISALILLAVWRISEAAPSTMSSYPEEFKMGQPT